MKKYIIPIIIILIFLNFNAFADTIVKNVDIKTITVYQGGTQVNCTVKLNLKKGENTFRLSNILPTINYSTIQIKTDKQIRIQSVQQYTEYAVQNKSNNKKIANLEDKAEKIREEICALKEHLAVYEFEEKMLKTNSPTSNTKTGIKVEDLKAATEFYRKKLTENNKKQMEIKRKSKKLSEELVTINRQINQLGKTKTGNKNDIMIISSTNYPKNYLFEITYFASGGSWTAKYDARAKDENSPIEVTYKADISQNTGIDWNDIKLRISTGKPLLSGKKPKLNTWFLNFVSAEYRKKTYTASQSGSQIFDIPINYSIPSDGKPYTVEIKKINLPAMYQHQCVPVMDDAAFLMARVSDWGKYSFVSGYMNLYFDGSFIGKSYLDASNTEDTLAFSMGRDESIVVERERLKAFEDNNIAKNIYEFAYEIKIRNKKNKAIELLIEDQVPVSQDKGISVEHIDLAGAKIDENTGKLTWLIKLKSSESKKIKFKYSVRFPKNMNVNLN